MNKRMLLKALAVVCFFYGIPLFAPILAKKIAQVRSDRALERAGYTNRGSNFTHVFKLK